MHRQKTAHPEVIHRDLWCPPAAKANGLFHRRENLALVADREFTLQAENAWKRTPDLVGDSRLTDRADAGLTSSAGLSIDPAPRRVESKP